VANLWLTRPSLFTFPADSDHDWVLKVPLYIIEITIGYRLSDIKKYRKSKFQLIGTSQSVQYSQHCFNRNSHNQWEMANFDAPYRTENPNQLQKKLAELIYIQLNQICIHWDFWANWWNITFLCLFYVLISFFSESPTGQMGWHILTQNSSNDANSGKYLPFGENQNLILNPHLYLKQ